MFVFAYLLFVELHHGIRGGPAENVVVSFTKRIVQVLFTDIRTVEFARVYDFAKRVSELGHIQMLNEHVTTIRATHTHTRTYIPQYNRKIGKVFPYKSRTHKRLSNSFRLLLT